MPHFRGCSGEPNRLPRADEVSAQVRREFPEEGGHAAFVSGPFPGNLGWLPRRLLDFFSEHRPAGTRRVADEIMAARNDNSK